MPATTALSSVSCTAYPTPHSSKPASAVAKPPRKTSGENSDASVRVAVRRLEIQRERHEQGAERGAGFVEGRVQAVDPAAAQPAGRVGEHGLDGRLADRPAG